MGIGGLAAENHRTQTQYDDALIVKAFFFQFLNNYTTLFYIGVCGVTHRTGVRSPLY